MKPNSLSCAARASFAAALLGAVCLVGSPAFAQEEVCAPPTVVDQPPPPLPDYDQPPIPAPGYIWSPGYWAWDSDESDYYWVPGTWTEPPRPGLLWTPGYWAWVAGAYVFHAGYWGPRVGYYGGIHYGYGYTGEGYEGGRWEHGTFFYNRTVNNIGNVTIRNVYEKKIVINNNTTTNISYNGGKGGVEAKPTPEDKTYARQAHFAPTPAQRQHVTTASKDPALFEKTNHGAPAVAATPRPADFKGPGVVPAHAAATQPGAAGKKPEEQKPAPGKPELEQKKPAAGAVQPGVEEKGKTPLTEEKKPAEGNKPALEQKKPLTEEKKQMEGNKPAVEEKKPAIQEKKPAIEEKKPVIEEKRPTIEEKRPTIEEKRPVEEKRPQPTRPETQSRD